MAKVIQDLEKVGISKACANAMASFFNNGLNHNFTSNEEALEELNSIPRINETDRTLLQLLKEIGSSSGPAGLPVWVADLAGASAGWCWGASSGEGALSGAIEGAIACSSAARSH